MRRMRKVTKRSEKSKRDEKNKKERATMVFGDVGLVEN
jgi:hypothetical protein